VADQVAPRQLGQGGAAVGGLERAEPVLDQRVGVLLAGHRSAHGLSPQGREEHQVDECLAGDRDLRPLQSPPQLGAVERTVGGQRPLDRLHRPLGRRLGDALLAQPPRATGEQGRRGQRVQQRVVLGPDQMQGAAVEPGDQQRALLAQFAIDVGRGEAGGASADRQPGPARILPLHRQQTLGDVDRPLQRGARKRLGGESFGDRRASHRTDDGDCRSKTIRRRAGRTRPIQR
jgi:hypothetical protein